MLATKELELKINEALPDAQVFVRDLKGTGDHFDAQVVCGRFQGMSRIARHQAVMAPLKPLFDSGILHAMAIKTYTLKSGSKRKKEFRLHERSIRARIERNQSDH